MCDCQVGFTDYVETFITYCPLHAAAEETAKQRDQLIEALGQIALGEGPFSRDPLEHCTNVVESQQAIARAAIAAAQPEEQAHDNDT